MKYTKKARCCSSSDFLL